MLRTLYYKHCMLLNIMGFYTFKRLESHFFPSQQRHSCEENIYSHVATLSYRQESCEEEKRVFSPNIDINVFRTGPGNFFKVFGVITANVV